ncbi:hypothetical protein IAT40_006829 [Kwoniella sp. CBS 6097]
MVDQMTPSAMSDEPRHHLTDKTAAGHEDTNKPFEGPGNSVVALGAGNSDREQDSGVAGIEGLHEVYKEGKWFWALWGSIFLLSYVYSLAQSTTPLYTQFATSSYDSHSLLGTIGTITTIMAGVVLPFIAKIADLFSRPTAISACLVLYVIGYAVIAGSKNVETVAAAQVISTLGSTGIYFMQGIVIADLTSIRWRGAFQGCLSLPFVINAFVGADIAADIGAFSENGWRWGYGMFCILIPVTLLPILFVLYAGQAKYRASHPKPASAHYQSLIQALRYHWTRVNGPGLILLGGSFVLILTPLTLGGSASNGYKTPSLIAMFVVGGVCLFAWGIWDIRFAKYPIMPRHIYKWTYLACVAVSFIYYMSYYSIMSYLPSWVYVVKDQFTDKQYTMFCNIPGVGLTLFAAPAGFAHAYFRRYKYQQIFGIGFLCVGSGLSFRATQNPTDAILVSSQIVYSMGSAVVMVSAGIGSQGSVPHKDLAIAIAIIALWSQIAGGIGSAIAASIWNRVLPQKLERYLGDTHNATEIADIFGSILVARIAEPRDAVITAYNETMHVLAAISLGIIFLALVAGFFAKDYVLTAAHNLIEEDKIIKIRKSSRSGV